MINGSGMWNELTIANLHIDKLFDTVGECRGIGTPTVSLYLTEGEIFPLKLFFIFCCCR